MPNISSWPFFEAVTETVLPGQTCSSPPRAICRTAVSVLAVMEEPLPMRLPAITADPVGREATGTIAGCATDPNVETVAGWAGGGGLALAFGSSGGFNRIVKRLPAPSQVYWRASERATVTRATGGEIWNLSTCTSVNLSPFGVTSF